MTIPYQPKVNARMVGFEQLINSEFHIVGITGVATSSPDTIRLIEVPVHDAPSTVIIPGFSETTGVPGLTQFAVNYANGRIAFNMAQNGNTVFVTYKGRGSEVDAEDVNELQIPLGSIANMNGTLTNGIVRPNNISVDVADNFIFPNNVTANGALFTKKQADWTGMAAPALSASSHGVIYFDSTSQSFQVSENGGAYQPLGFVATGVQYQLAYYAVNGRTLSGLALITPLRAVVSDVNGLPVASATTAIEIGFVSGVTSSIQTQINSKVSKAGDTMSGTLNMGSNSITNVLNPIAAQDAATKYYVDTVAQGITWKQVIRLGTAAFLPNSPTYFNGASGVGATLTATVNGALSVDGILVAVSDRILVKDQASTLENGIYDVTDAGSAGTPYVLTRSTDANSPTEIQAGSAVFISEGATNIELGFIQIAIVTAIGTSPITFTQFTGAAYITTIYPLQKTGNTMFLAEWGIDNSLINGVAAVELTKLASTTPKSVIMSDKYGYMTASLVKDADLRQRIFHTILSEFSSPSGDPPTFAFLSLQAVRYTSTIVGEFGNDFSVRYVEDFPSVVKGSEYVDVFSAYNDGTFNVTDDTHAPTKYEVDTTVNLQVGSMVKQGLFTSFVAAIDVTLNLIALSGLDASSFTNGSVDIYNNASVVVHVNNNFNPLIGSDQYDVVTAVNASRAVIPLSPNVTTSPAGVNTGTGEFTTNAPHGLPTGEVQLGYFTTTGTLPAFLIAPQDYYFMFSTGASTYKIAATAANANAGIFISLGSTGTGDQTFNPIAPVTVFTPSAVTVPSGSISGNVFTYVGHGLSTGLAGQFTTTNTLPSPLMTLTNYYIIRLTADTFSVAFTLADATSGIPIILTTSGIGNQTFQPTINTQFIFGPPENYLKTGLNAPIEGSTWYNAITHQFKGFNGSTTIILG